MKIILLILLPMQLLSQSKILFKNVNIIDVEKGQVISNQNVLIDGNRIKNISSKNLVSKKAIIINAKGKFLIPGLWDMHVHLFNNRFKHLTNEYYFPLFIANGVTGVRDMWTKPSSMPQVTRWRKQVDELPGTVTRIGAVGTMIDGVPVSWPGSDSVKTAEEARNMVRSIKASGIDFIKVYERLSRETYFAIADESKKLDIPYAGHVPFAVTPGEASDAGQKSIEHLTGIDGYCEVLIPRLKKQLAATPQHSPEHDFIEHSLDLCNDEKAFPVFQRMAKNKTYLVPTFPTFLARNFKGEILEEDPRLIYISATDKQEWKSYSSRRKNFTQGRMDTLYDYLQKIYTKVAMMNKAGIHFLAGTDAGFTYVFPGFSLHDDLGGFVQAGLSPAEALRTATINPAIFLNKQKELGTVEVGKLADLVLLNANPLQDISNTRKINAVVANGKLLNRKDLDKLLEDAKAIANKK